jgi:hypothetical protein
MLQIQKELARHTIPEKQTNFDPGNSALWASRRYAAPSTYGHDGGLTACTHEHHVQTS